MPASYLAWGDVQPDQLAVPWLVHLGIGQCLDALLTGHLFELFNTHLMVFWRGRKQEGGNMVLVVKTGSSQNPSTWGAVLRRF